MVSILTVVGIMGVAFAFSLHLETQATREFVSTTQARYLAEGGVSHARALLDEDRLGTRIDELGEPWAHEIQGADADVDGDGALDARWWTVTGPSANPLGRYALRIADESGKANLNVAQAQPPTLGLEAIDLAAVLDAAQIANASAVAGSIEQYRHGDDGRPGVAGVDDDGDGAIDETDEYQPMAPRGDDRRLESLEDLATVVSLKAEEIRRLSRVATVYSRDLNVTVSGTPRINVNTATADELLAVWLEAGAGDPWHTAVNMADAVDADVEMSRVMKSSQLILLGGGSASGGWTWSTDPEGHYRSEQSGGAPLSWTAAVPAGTFRVLARGLRGVRVGDVTLGGETKPAVEDGDSLGLFELSGVLAVEVANEEPAGTPCAFRGLELVPEQVTAGVAVRGIEAVRFNELMIDPALDLDVSGAAFDAQGSDWGCPVNSEACVNSGVGQARWSWTSAVLQPGRYYVRVFGTAAGQTVGEVRIDGQTQLLVHGQSHPRTIGVGSDGKISFTIGKTASEGTYYLKAVTLSLQPDGEYVELINLSDREIDVSGWAIDGELTGGREARLPSGTVLKAHGLLIAAVDLDDSQPGLSNNGIDARSAWAIPDEAEAVQLEFVGGTPSQDDDWLKSSVPGGSATRLRLRRAESVVDEVEYVLPPPTTAAFQSVEKGDPTVIADQDADGVDDGWYPSLKLYTPGVTNDNNGLRELIGLEVIVHDPAEEVTVLNRPLQGVGELAGVPSGEAWTPLAVADLARVADRFTVEGLSLEPSGRLVGGEGAWQETGDGSYAYSSASQPVIAGTWQWRDVPNGSYRLSVYGWPGERLSARWQQRDDTWTDWSPELSTDAQGRVVIGQITIGPPSSAEGAGVGTRDYTLTLDLRCASQSGVCHLDHVGLDPQLIRLGAVNVNTASEEVLLALPGMTQAKVSRLLGGRPYGDRDQKGRGIGDLLLGDALGTDEEEILETFRQLGHLVTTHSDVFQIMSLGQSAQQDRGHATQRILTVVER
ncbi:MAG: general secretion pathway protein GspK [Candidatus Omnitrophica bacterium]|nr:general secretion pathway protein GspK [Candidatus Omnitrophota bacterium]